ncbi:MAG: ABC transporter substrate-binding protein [Clostridia bacterium]|nr:ABC transporter substrate-binding protein [Clostridia bacterium]
MHKRKITALLLILGLTLAVLAGCGGNQAPPAEQGSQQNEETSNEPITLIIGATPEPHAEILLKAKELLKDKGIELDIREFTDYTTPNIALNDGSLDANFFQHVPYLNEFKEQNNMDLTWTTAVHFEPLGLYSRQISDLSELKDGDRIAVPNDTTNEARALWLLQDNGIITLKDGVGLTATVADITEYHVQVQIIELEAPQLPSSLEDVTAAVINGNYAIGAGLNPAKDAIVMEDPTSLAADTYKNVVAVKVGNENRPEIIALGEVLTSPEMKQFIEEKYQGAVVPVF